MKTALAFLALLCLPAAVFAQESVRAIEGRGPNAKYLTPGQLDTWTFTGEKGETIIAHAATREFDSILELAVKGEKEDKVLLEVDDEGSDSRFAVRLPERGEYRIRVHGFKYQGGGNYVLHIRRFLAQPLQVGKPELGTFDREGKSYHYFSATKDQILIPEIRGAAANSWKMLDPKGRELSDWFGAVVVPEAGEYSLVVTGPPENRYDLVVREAKHRDLPAGQTLKGQIQQNEMDVWSVQGKPGDFRVVEVEKQGELASRLIFAPLQAKAGNQIAGPGELPAIQYLPIGSRGNHLRFAALLGREGRYQLQLLAQTPASYQVQLSDPTVPIERSREAKDHLPIGGSAFYSFKATAGQLIQARLSSPSFAPLLRLYDVRGNFIAMNDDAMNQTSQITYMIREAGLFRLQVSSIGDGGGGEFRLGLQDKPLKELTIGGRSKGTLQPNATDFWAFAGKEGQTVIFSVRCATCQPTLSLHSPDGVRIGNNDNNAMASDVLMSAKLPKTGRYTLWIGTQRGAGEYSLRIIDGD
jgi:hypothetical protein